MAALAGGGLMASWKCWLAAGVVAGGCWLLPARAPVVSADPHPAARKGADKKPAPRPGEIDVEKSRVYVFVGKKGLGHEHGVEGRITSGTIRLNVAQKAGEIEFDMTSFLADTDEARKFVGLQGSTAESTRKKVTEAMLGEAVLDVEEFPAATFRIESSTLTRARSKNEPDTVEFKGQFTLHGKTRPLALRATVESDGSKRHLRGEFTILQSDFGITPYKAALGTVGVTDELKIRGDLWIHGEPKR